VPGRTRWQNYPLEAMLGANHYLPRIWPDDH
jgi:hypothetical protein